MALGNSNSSSQSRGKNKPVIVKRRKEVVLAKDFHAISGSLVTGGPGCNLHNGTVTQTYYHDATNAGILVPGGCQTGTFVYTRKRAHNDFLLPDGNYKNFININSIGNASKSFVYMDGPRSCCS